VSGSRAQHPQRIVCLTEETVETLYLLGAQDRIVGITGYAVRPPQARKEKPRVAAFTSARIDKILALEPDHVVGFSDLQAEIAAELIRAGIAVTIFNQRDLQGILDMILTLGAMVGAQAAAEELVGALARRIESARTTAQSLPRRPRVYFEEWDEPLISGIRWVSELIEAAGGQDCFAELARHPDARSRIIVDPTEVARRAPDIIVGSWCGKRFRPEQVRGRPGWAEIPAVRAGALHEIKSAEILQPGPAALTDGLDRLQAIIGDWAHAQ
jgi:iron complex transport system substrate-binding protein